MWLFSRKAYCICLKKRSMIRSGLSAHVCALSCLSWHWSLRCLLSIKYVSPPPNAIMCSPHEICRQAESRLAQDPPKTAMSTWLPYTLIDQLLVATNEKTQSDLSKRAITLRRDLHREISNRAGRAQKLSHRLYQEL